MLQDFCHRPSGPLKPDYAKPHQPYTEVANTTLDMCLFYFEAFLGRFQDLWEIGCHHPTSISLLDMLSALNSLQPRQLLTQVLNFALVLSTAFMLWKGLSVITDSPSPIVVVLSGSMEPAFQRGDLLFLWNRGQDTQIGEIVVYNVRGKDIPIVHRVVRRYGGG